MITSSSDDASLGKRKRSREDDGDDGERVFSPASVSQSNHQTRVHGKAVNAIYGQNLTSICLGRSRSLSWRRARASGPWPSWRSVDHPSRSLRSVEPALYALLLNFNSTSLIHAARLVHPFGHLQFWAVFLRQSRLKPKRKK